LAEELPAKGVRVNALHPGGVVDTALVPAWVPADARARMLRPPVICPAAVWLASDESPDVTGQVIDARKWNEARGISIGLRGQRNVTDERA
jgi:NAD(P)-dependent dehydrogenase (short-subunit alcohol dehydrogenase family)